LGGSFKTFKKATAPMKSILEKFDLLMGPLIDGQAVKSMQTALKILTVGRDPLQSPNSGHSTIA